MSGMAEITEIRAVQLFGRYPFLRHHDFFYRGKSKYKTHLKLYMKKLLGLFLVSKVNLKEMRCFLRQFFYTGVSFCDVLHP